MLSASVTLRLDANNASDQGLLLATKEALTDQGCEVILFSSNGNPPSKNNLLVNLTQFHLEEDRSQFQGYGVQMDSILWTAFVDLKITDLASRQILVSIQERTEERVAESINGSSVGSMPSEAQLTNLLKLRLGQQIAKRIGNLANHQEICPGALTVVSPNSEAPQPPTTVAEQTQPTLPKVTGAVPMGGATSNLEKNTGADLTKVTEYRIALVIGNADYTSIPRLGNPINDAKLVSQKIRAAGFELIGDRVLSDLSKSQLEASIDKFGKKLSEHPGAIGFFYYAGHGLQVNGSNFLVPVDANPNRVADLERQTIRIDNLLQEMEDSRTGLNIIVLDACRNNPFGGRGIRESMSGLAQMKAPKGSIIVYATQPGNIAQDGPAGQNSPFAWALALALDKPDLDLFGTFNQVGLLVSNKTGGSQQPWMSSSPIAGHFCFVGCRP